MHELSKLKGKHQNRFGISFFSSLFFLSFCLVFFISSTPSLFLFVWSVAVCFYICLIKCMFNYDIVYDNNNVDNDNDNDDGVDFSF